ncbi:DUF2795 domain-containing protein [Segeticoccus rhizosphaerae]|uniref:DUF2795 domain-containing protein n=1 Tax=Segeticoccus rhizosphaerae TaxID=1104777 RepID=UPI0013905010|nr:MULTISPECIES: DUF2795 domain-containing protein [Intrasporangiaceae]
MPVTAGQLVGYLPPAGFPADREEVLAAAVDHHAPPVVLELLLDLPAHRHWPDLPALCSALGTPTAATRS